MKKTFLFFVSILLTACHPMDEVVNSEAELVPVKFQLSLKEDIFPFTQTKAMPPLNIPEPPAYNDDPKAPEGEKDLPDLCSAIEYLVFNEDNNEQIRHFHFTKADDDFGIIYDSLPAGSYKIAVLAHSSLCKKLDNHILTLENITDIFHINKSLSVSKKEEIVEYLTLARIVGRIEFVSTNTVTENLKTFDLNISNYPGRIDMFTGKGVVSSEKKTFRYSFQTEDLKFGFMTLVPENDGKLDIGLVVTDVQGEVFYSRSIANVLPFANRTIRYTGNLYPSASDNTFILSVENGGKWDDDVDYVLED